MNEKIYDLLHVTYNKWRKDNLRWSNGLKIAPLHYHCLASPLKNNSITLPLFGLIIYPPYTQNVP